MFGKTCNNSMKLSGDSVVKLVVMAKDNPRERHWSLMVFYSYRSVRCCSSSMVIMTCNHMMLLCMMTSMVMLTTGVMILVVSVAVVIILLLRRLSLTVLLILHPSILKPYLHLSFCQVQIARQLPPFLFGHVSVEKEFFFQF
jgi:hypothetical protein